MVRAWGRGAFFVELTIELVAALGKGIEPRHAFQVDEVVGFLGVLQRKLGRTPPPVRLRPQISNLCHRPPQKRPHVSRNFLPRHPVDGSMPLIAPRPGPHALQKNEGREPQADQTPSRPPRFHFTMQDSSTPLASNQNAKCSESCRKRGLPTVCWITPKLPAGGICGGPSKLGKKETSLFGASKSGWLKILNASASNFRWKRLLIRNCL